MSSSNKNSEIQYKAAPQGTVNLDEAQGIVECFVAGIGNKDSVGDVCAPGAFGKSLTRRKPRVVWGHNWNDPIGKVLDMYEVPPSDPRLPDKMKSAGIGGLYARVQFNLKSEKGREAFASVAFFGEEQEWSIGYKTINAKFDPQMQANILYEVELYEVSPVLHGANQLTGTISVKSEEQPHMVSVNDSPVLEGFDVTELSSVLDALKTLASISTDEQKGHGPMQGMMPTGMPGMPTPKPMHAPANGPAPREVVKPEVPSMPENPMVMAIRRELAERTGSNVIIRSAVDNVVVFDRILSDGTSATYRLPFYYAGDEFMFGKPEKVNTQTVYVPEMPAMPGAAAQSNPYSFEAGKSLISFEDSTWGSGFNQSMPTEQVNASALNSVINNLQKLVEEKSTYVISVNIEDAFQVKQAIDPILSYYNVDAAVTEEGIVVKSLNKEFLDAVDIATKGVLRSLRNAVGRVNTPNIGSNRGDRTPNLASRGPGIGSRGAVVKLRDGSTWDPKSAPDKNRNGIVGEGLYDSSGRSLAQPDPTPAGPDSVRAPKTSPKKSPKKDTRLSSGYVSNARGGGTVAPGATPDGGMVKISINGDSDESIKKIQSTIEDAMRANQMISFNYNGKNREIIPIKIEKSKTTGYTSLTGQDKTGTRKFFRLDRILKSDSERLSSGADDYFKKIIKEKGPVEWADLSEDDQIEFAYQLEDEYIYDRGFGDDAGVDALESGVYADAIQEYAEDWYNDELDKVKAPRRLSSGNTTPDENLIAMSLQEDLNPRVDDGKIDSGIAEAGKRIAARWSKLSKAKKNEAVADKFDISIDDASNQEIIDTAIDLASNEGLLDDLNLGRLSSGGNASKRTTRRLSSGKVDFDKKGESGLREMRHVERNPLRDDTEAEKTARADHEKWAANFKKNNGWYVEVPMYTGDDSSRSEEWFRGREAAINVAKLRFEDPSMFDSMQMFDRPGKPSKKEFFARTGTSDYKSWYMYKIPGLTDEIDSVTNSKKYSDDYKKSFADAMRTFMYANRPEISSYPNKETQEAYEKWIQQAGLGWGGRYSNSGERLSSGGNKNNVIRSYENPEDLKEAMLKHLFENIADYKNFTAKDIADAIGVNPARVKPFIDEVKDNVSDAEDEWEKFSNQNAPTSKVKKIAADFAKAQTVSDKFSEMTDEEAEDYAASLDEETWRDKDERFSSGGREKLTKYQIADNIYKISMDELDARQRKQGINDEDIIFSDIVKDVVANAVRVGIIDAADEEEMANISRFSSGKETNTPEDRATKFYSDMAYRNAGIESMTPEELNDYAEEWSKNNAGDSRFSSGKEVLGRDISYFEPTDEEDSAYEEASGLVKREMYKDYADIILENISDMLAPDSVNSEQINEYIAKNIDEIIADMDNPDNFAGLPDTPASRRRIEQYKETVDSLKKIAKLPEEERTAAFAKASQEIDMYDLNYSLAEIMEKDNSDFTKQFESSLIEDIVAQIRNKDEELYSAYYPSEDGSYKRFSSGGMPDPEEEKELIAMAKSRAKNGNFEESLADQYEGKGRLSIKQWEALRNIANRFPKKTTASETEAPSAPFSRKPRKIIDIADVEEYGYPELPDNIKPTPEQGAAIDAMMTGADVKIRALAATGKTTTVINFANRLKNTEPGARVVYLVFNKNAKDDVEKRGMPTNVFVSTMDGISYRAMDALNPEMTKKSFSKKTGHIKPIKSFKDRAAYLGTRGLVTQGNELSDVDVFKRVSKAVDAFSISDDKEISKKHFTGAYNGKLAVDDDAILPEMISLAKKMWLDMNEPRVDGPDRKSKKGMLPISNMHLTKMWALTEPDIGQVAESNVAMIDEAQDMNPVFAGILRNSKNIQRIYIGDTNQAINAWRGADGKTLEDAEAVHDMPITDSFRFGKEVAAVGNRFLSLLGTKDRMTGRKTDRSGKPVDGIIGPVDNPTMILTRANGGAIAATMQVFANGGTVYGSKNFKTDLENFINNIEWMENGEKGKSFYTGLDGEKIFYAPEASQDLDGITNMAEFKKAIEQADNNRLNMLSKLMEKYSVAELRNALNKIITDKNKLPKNRDEYVHIQTAHTSKGLESPRVQIWTDFRGPKLDESGELVFPDEQELRLSYVAVTRAEEQLDLGSLSWIFEHTSDADGEPNTFSSGASRPRRQGGGKGRQEPWSAEDRQRFADRNVLRAQTRQGKKPEGPTAGEFSSGRFAPDGRGGSRLQRRLSSGEVKGPPPEGSKRYNSKEQIAATMSALHSEPGTALLLDSDKNILGALPKNKQSHVLNAEAAKRIIADPDNEYSAETGWPIDAGKLLDFVEVNQEDAVRTLREINDADAIASILGVQPKDAQDMLDGKPVYIPSNTAGEMLDRLKKENRYPEGIRGTNDVLRIWGYDGAPKWVRSSDIATPEFDLDEDGMVNWSEVKWDGLSKAEFDAEVARGKNPPEPVEVSPVEFFNSEAIYSNPKWDARAGSLKNPTVDEEFNAPTKKLKREEQLEPERFQSQKLAGSMVGRADKDFMSEWRAGSHRINANQMMDILGLERTSEGASINTADARKLLMELNRIKQEAGGGLPLNSQGADGSFRPALESEIKKNPMTDEVMHALIASGKFKNMKEAVASLGDSRLDSLAAEYDSRMLVDAALIRIKDQMNKAGAADQKKILAKAITSSLGRKTDLEKRVQEGRVSIKGIMTEDGMIGDEKISEIVDLVNAELSRRGLEKIDKDSLFPKDETGGFISNLSAVLPGGRMSSGERFVARNASNRRAEAMSDAASRRAGSPRLSSGELEKAPSLTDANGKISPSNIGQAAKMATLSVPEINSKTSGENLIDFEKAVKTRAEIAKLFNINEKNTPGFSVYDFEDELKKSGFSEEESTEMVDRLRDLDNYIDEVESKFSEARDLMDDSLEKIQDNLDKVEKLKKEKTEAINRWGEEDAQVWVEAIDEKIADSMKTIDEAYENGIGGPSGEFGGLHSEVEDILKDNPGWKAPYGGKLRDINSRLVDVEMAISKAGGVKKPVPVTSIDFGVPDGTRLSSGKSDEYFQNLTSHLIAMIEKSQQEGGKWEAPWHKVENMPKNASTKNMYSGGNLFALMLAAEEKGYATPQWSTFQQWKGLGATVKKGEKGTQILVPTMTFGDEIDPETGKKKRFVKGVYFKTAHVFNLDQVEGIDREEFLKTPTDMLSPEQKVSKLEEAINQVGAVIKTGDGSKAYYSPSEDHVVMPPFELFKSPEGYYGVLAHELVHWTGHSSRLDRNNMNQFGSPDYAREELVAEFGAAFLLAMFGLSSEPRPDHAHYLANWLKVLRDEPNALQEASVKAQAAAKLLIGKMQSVIEDMGEVASDAESTVDVKSSQIFLDPLYGVKDAYMAWSLDSFNSPHFIKSLTERQTSSGLVNRSWERIAETAIFLERLSKKK